MTSSRQTNPKQQTPKPTLVNSLINPLAQTLGLSVIGTTVAVGCHHLWRKRSNSNAKLSDYLMGTAQQWQRIEQSNQQAWRAWQQTYYQKTNFQQTDFQKNAFQQTDFEQTNVQQTSHQANHQNSHNNKENKLNHVQWVSGVANKNNGSIKNGKTGSTGEFDDFSVVGIDKHRQIVWQTDVPERVHDIVVQPSLEKHSQAQTQVQTKNQSNNNPPSPQPSQENKRHVAVMGRRPSEYFWIMDCATGELLHTIKAKDLQQQENRHFYGHACYSLDGNLLYVAENDTDSFAGMVGVYDVANDYQKIEEFATHGIGPHELIMHPDGDKLIVANGGIKTERASREELNIESMQPSLVYLALVNGTKTDGNNPKKGEILQQIQPKHNQMSVRHISAVTHGKFKGTVAIGIQFQGDKHLNMPLILTHKFADDEFIEYSMDNTNITDTKNTDAKNQQKASWRQFHHYIASVLVNANSNLICATSPIGGCVSVFDMTSQRLIDTVKIADCAGIAIAKYSHSQSPNHNRQDGFLVSDGQGGLTLLSVDNGKLITDKIILPMAFDNHMQVVG